MADQQRDVIEILTQDHREVEALFTELEALLGATGEAELDRRKDLVDQVTIELVRHAVAEETQVYPRVQEKVSAEEAERAKQEHAEAERTLKRLDDLDPGDPAFDAALGTLMREIREHVTEEEGQMFPHMRQVFSPDDLIEMGREVESFKKIAPTRPHPATPNEPAARKLVGPVAGLFDRLRDAATGRGIER
jgi:hemerythrin superfamily protein